MNWLILALLSWQGLAAPTKNVANDLIKARLAHLEGFYQDLHANPELSGQERRTAEKTAAEFRQMGLEVIENIGGYSVVAILKNGNGPVTMIRSDLDALPVTEKTKLSYASKNTGVMHACAHDYHTAALVGTAYVMAQTKNDWQGTLIFLAQPKEEIGQGARDMIKDGLFKKIPKPQQVFALHTSGLYERGKIAFMKGPMTANVDSVEVTMKGKGTHGSTPEKGIDPVVLAAEFVLKMQTLITREKRAMDPAVITVGSIHGGTKANIISEEVKMQLTVRTYKQEVREKILKRITEIAKGIAATAGAPEPIVTHPEWANSVFNDIKLTERTVDVLRGQFGANNILEVEPIMGGEDFGEFGREVGAPSFMFWIGERHENDKNILNHSPLFFPEFRKTAPMAIHAMTLAVMDFHKR